MDESQNTDKLDIFVCTHKDFTQVVTNPCYKVINVKDIDTKDLGLPYDDAFHSELVAFYWAVKNHAVKDYIGFCHYRRYLSFLDDIPNLDEVFKDHDVIVPKPMKMPITVREHYAICHNVEDLDIVKGIVDEWFPQYSSSVEAVFNGKYLFTNNMFIMKRDDFLEFFSLYKNVMDRYLTIIGGDIDKHIEDNKDKYLKHFKDAPQNGEVWYQKRIGGFMAERLLTAFIFKKFKRPKMYDIVVTEKKYNLDKISEVNGTQQ